MAAPVMIIVGVCQCSPRYQELNGTAFCLRDDTWCQVQTVEIQERHKSSGRIFVPCHFFVDHHGGVVTLSRCERDETVPRLAVQLVEHYYYNRGFYASTEWPPNAAQLTTLMAAMMRKLSSPAYQQWLRLKPYHFSPPLPAVS